MSVQLLYHAVGLGVECRCCDVIHLHLGAPRGPRAGGELRPPFRRHVGRQAKS